MELVPIITQVLTIFAAAFAIVLIVSFVASKLKKNDRNFEKAAVNIGGVNNQYIPGTESNNLIKKQNNHNHYQNNEYRKEIKVVKRSTSLQSSQSTKARRTSYQTPSHTQRFTVLNSIDVEKPSQSTDEFGFKIYPDDNISRSVYL